MDFSFGLRQAAEYYFNAVKELELTEKDNDSDALPGNAYFLNDTDVVCFDRDFGVSRQPYYADGLTMWCKSSGYISVQEGQHTVFRFIRDGEEPCIVAYAGFPLENGGFLPVSITGVAKNLEEPEGTERFAVFTPSAAYYFTYCFDTVLCLRAFVTKDKQMSVSAVAINKGNKKKKIYLSLYADPLLRYMSNEDAESYWFKSSEYFVEKGFILHTSKDAAAYLAVATHSEGEVSRKYRTTARTMVTGKSDEGISVSENFREGSFADCIYKSAFKDNSVAAELLHFTIPSDESAEMSFCMKLFDALDKAMEYINEDFEQRRLDEAVECIAKEGQEIHSPLKLHLGSGVFGKAQETVNRFIESVKRQAYFCAMGKNYCGPKIGMRDVYQQLEATVFWCPEESGKRLVKYLNYISPSGRTPRQITVTEIENEIPPYDAREFVDQGLWIISAFFTYLSYTGDYSVLDEICGYYEFDDGGVIAKSEKQDTVLEHLIAIMQYLENNLDKENTGCLRALYGDWNDALDGLGKTDDKDRKFGNGVSVMATLQFYGNLCEMEKILRKTGKFPERALKYSEMQKKLAADLFEYAVACDGENVKILHGWGDKRSYFVGSFKDSDGIPRDSLTANAFWVLSGMYSKNTKFKEHIMAAIDRLDSKYGLKTFEPYFAEDVKGVGRIVNLPPGTAENSCAYIHASLFGIMALFKMGEAEEGWRQLAKSITITHERISSTSYVMPNSWCHNKDFGIDGESMSDWHTGSGAVLIKILVGYIFGIQPDLEGVNIRFPKFLPTDNASAELVIRGKRFIVSYENLKKGKRSFEYNGRALQSGFNEELNGQELVIPYGELCDGAVLKITD